MSATLTPTTQFANWHDGWPDHLVAQGNADRATDIALRRWERYIAMTADGLSPRDAVLADDLAQAARIELWQIDPSRFGAEDRKYLQTRLKSVIRHELRVLSRTALSSLHSPFELFEEDELPVIEPPPVERLRSSSGPWPLAFWFTVIGEAESHVWI